MFTEEIMPGLIVFIALFVMLIGASKSKAGKTSGKKTAANPQKKTTVSRQPSGPKPAAPVYAEGEDPDHDHALPKESPQSSRVAWGSMSVETGEGEDPGHDHALHIEPTLPEEEADILPDFSGNELVRAFILQEILKRPDERTDFGI